MQPGTLLSGMVSSHSRWMKHPLAYAVEHARLRVMQVLLVVDPVAPMTLNGFHSTMIHYCVSMTQHAARTLPLLLHACPAAARLCDHHNNYPLHEAVSLRDPSAIDLFFRTYPEALQKYKKRITMVTHRSTLLRYEAPRRPLDISYR